MGAPLGNQNALGNSGGRPTKYRPEYAEQAYKLCMLRNCTDEELAQWFDVDPDTIYEWKKNHVEFSESIHKGKVECDFDVSRALFHRAIGYSHEAVKIVADAKTGSEHVVPYTEHYPPDTAAAFIWLKNRHPDRWRDRQHVAIEDPDEVLSKVLGVKKEELP